MAVSPLRRQALLERERVLDALATAWAEASAERGRLVLVAGEAGGGKTAVVRGFCADLDAPVLLGGCDPLFTPRPLGPFVDLVEEVGDAHEVVAALVRSAEGPRVLVLEDLHWADEATLDALRLLARKVEGTSLLVVATYRDDELDRLHPLRVVLGELATAAIERVSVGRLSLAAVAELAEGSGVDAEELHRVTGGNPFFVTEVLAAPDAELPATVRDAVLGRVARLGIQARALLEAVAIVPPRAEPWLLDALAGESTEALDECVASGMLVARDGSVEFRHELARLAVVETIQPVRASMLHRLALAALAEPPLGASDPARLAHHAEAAGDRDAVLRFAVAAAERATALGAHREAAAQYERALRFAEGLPSEERANLLERQSQAFYLMDDQVKAIAALEQAIEYRRRTGDQRGEGYALSQLVPYFTCRGAVPEARAAGREAVALLEPLTPGPELLMAYHSLAIIGLVEDDAAGALEWATRAGALAESLGDAELAVTAAITAGTAEYLRSSDGRPSLEAALELAERIRSPERVVRALNNLAEISVLHRLHADSDRFAALGIARCEDHDLDLWRLSLLGIRVRAELLSGRWTEASTTAELLIDDPRDSPDPRFQALLVRALVRARRGDPHVHEPLATAVAIEGSPEVLAHSAKLAAATAEIAWLEGSSEGVREATEFAFARALERESSWLIGELAYWRRKAGIVDEMPNLVPEPYALQLAGDWAGAAAAWEALACPYELALALSEADDEAALRRAVDEARALGARPLATMVARRLRELGVRGVTRGPRASTRANAAALTGREVEVLRLLAEGLRNAAIAERLFVSTRTIDHHVSSILRKLEVAGRFEAVAAGKRLGLLHD